MDKLKFALVGCGRIAAKHAEAAAANADTMELAVVCDLVEERMARIAGLYAEKTGARPQQVQEYRELLADPAVDAVAVATESGLHAKICLEAIGAGKHVLVEKPMALSVQDCRRLVAAAEEQGVKLGVCHQNRFNPPIQKLRRAVEAGRMGRLINGTAAIRWNRNQDYYRQAPWRGTWAMDGGTLMNQCIHNIDLLQWMLGGEVESVYAQTGTFLRDIEAEDFGALVIRFKGGTIGIVEGSACVYPTNLEETLNIFGETGTVCIGGLAVNKITNWQVAGDDSGIADACAPDPDSVYGSGHKPLYRDFCQAVINNTRPYIDGREGMKAVEIILAAYKSQRDGVAVRLPLTEFSTLDMKRV
jgi:UDP-N-acetyl-2-amino-2-deoxyglucuronate dehydrogenase